LEKRENLMGIFKKKYSIGVGVVACTCNPYTQELEFGRILVRG
jgi:hypothetical protein